MPAKRQAHDGAASKTPRPKASTLILHLGVPAEEPRASKAQRLDDVVPQLAPSSFRGSLEQAGKEELKMKSNHDYMLWKRNVPSNSSCVPLMLQIRHERRKVGGERDQSHRTGERCK